MELLKIFKCPSYPLACIKIIAKNSYGKKIQSEIC